MCAAIFNDLTAGALDFQAVPARRGTPIAASPSPGGRMSASSPSGAIGAPDMPHMGRAVLPLSGDQVIDGELPGP